MIYYLEDDLSRGMGDYFDLRGIAKAKISTYSQAQ